MQDDCEMRWHDTTQHCTKSMTLDKAFAGQAGQSEGCDGHYGHYGCNRAK